MTGDLGRAPAPRRRALALALVALLVVLALGGAALLLRPVGDARAALLSGDYGAARALLSEAAESGDAAAQNTLANLYLLGLGVPVDHRAAARLYLRAALAENVAAQVNLGHLYSQGRGVGKDPLRAFAWYRHAQLRGSRTAEGLMRYLVGGMKLTPNQIQWVKAHYGTLADLAF